MITSSFIGFLTILNLEWAPLMFQWHGRMEETEAGKNKTGK